MLKKGDKFKFTCLSIREATPDFILFYVKEEPNEAYDYFEKYQKNHLLKNVEYEATVTGRLVHGLTVLTTLSVNSIEDDSIRDREVFRVEYRSIFGKISRFFSKLKVRE